MVDLHSDGGFGQTPERSRRPEKPAAAPLTDREVPLQQDLGSTTRVLSPAIHAWLDGELPEASVRRGETAADVEFWKTMNAESERRRSLRMAPALEARIMESLPHSIPALITPWYRREFVITPGAAVTIGASLVTMTAAATALLLKLLK
ncbi:MAG TPA: hypothetical protein VIV65_08215 [Gemmatimonadaceae bacterium]